MRKCLVVLGFAVLVAVVGFSLRSSWTAPVEAGVTPDNFRRLHKGMRATEIETILGEPKSRFGRKSSLAMWDQGGCHIVIEYDHLRFAIYGYLQKNGIGNNGGILRDRPKSFFEQVRDFIGF